MGNRLSWLANIERTIIGAPYCVLCHETSSSLGLCAGCLNDMQILRLAENQTCPGCARLSLRGVLCGHCQTHPPPTVALFASYAYQPPISTLLYAYKHQHQPVLAPVIAALMVEHAPPWLGAEAIDEILVLPMPLSRKRLSMRGFNQSGLLVDALAKHYCWPVLSPLRIGRIHRAAQSTLKQAERLRNVRGIFKINADVKNRNVLLIDDVVTTGATIAELAQALKKAGARSVWAWALARPL